MIILLLVLMNLTTVVLLNALSDSAHTWRLSQYDLQLARAERVLESAAAVAYQQFQQANPLVSTLTFSAGYTALLQQQNHPCETTAKTPTQQLLRASSKASAAGPTSASWEEPLLKTSDNAECVAVTISVTRESGDQQTPNPLHQLHVQRTYWWRAERGFTLPEVMLALALLTLTLPAFGHLLGQVGSFWPRVNQAYQEDKTTQNWLYAWQQQPPASRQTGTFADGRSWLVQPNAGLWYWQVQGSAESVAEEGWYLVREDRGKTKK